MRIVTNQKLVRRNTRIAQYLFIFSLGVLIVGLYVTNMPLLTGQLPTSEADVALSLLIPLVLPVGLVSTLVSVRMTNLWVRRPRPEAAIAEGLKGLSNKSVLYNYYHFPARHVLICPQGVFAMITRFQDGHFSVEGEKWRTHRSAITRVLGVFRLDGIGDPTYEARRAAAHVKKLLEPIAPGVEVQPLIVFVDPRVKLEVKDPAVPVVHTHEKYGMNLKDFLRSLRSEETETPAPEKGKKGKGKPKAKKEGRMPLAPEQIAAFEAATVSS